MLGPHRVHDAVVTCADDSATPHIIVRCGNPHCVARGGDDSGESAVLMRLLLNNGDPVSAILICWKCGANNTVVVRREHHGSDEGEVNDA